MRGSGPLLLSGRKRSKLCLEPFEQRRQAQRRLLPAPLADGERVVRLAVAVDDREGDLLDLGVADPLAEGLVATVDVGAVPVRLEPAPQVVDRLAVLLADGDQAHLHRREPEGEGAAVVLDDDPDEALERHRIEYVIGEGEGTFYAPKIDLHMRDTLGRSWQMGTIQADAQMPRRFGLTYMGADNQEHHPYVIHRALLGSLERFIGILTEHYAGAFPFWIAPVQVRILPVGEGHRAAALAVAQKLGEYRVEVDESDETVGKRIRSAEVEKIPFVVVYVDKESDEALAIREHGGAQETLALQDFQAKLATLSPWQAGAEPSLTS